MSRSTAVWFRGLPVRAPVASCDIFTVGHGEVVRAIWQRTTDLVWHASVALMRLGRALEPAGVSCTVGPRVERDPSPTLAPGLPGGAPESDLVTVVCWGEYTSVFGTVCLNPLSHTWQPACHRAARAKWRPMWNPVCCESSAPLLAGVIYTHLYSTKCSKCQSLKPYCIQHTLSDHFIRYLLDLFFLLFSSAAVAYSLRGLMHCVFRDALLHTTVVMRGPSPLTLTMHFWP